MDKCKNCGKPIVKAYPEDIYCLDCMFEEELKEKKSLAKLDCFTCQKETVHEVTFEKEDMTWLQCTECQCARQPMPNDLKNKC